LLHPSNSQRQRISMFLPGRRTKLLHPEYSAIVRGP